MKSHDDLKQIAIGIHRGEIFTSAQIPEPDQKRLISMVFMPLALMTEPQIENLKAQSPALFYGRIPPNGRCINGYPILHDFNFLIAEEWEVVRAMVTKLDDMEKAL